MIYTTSMPWSKTFQRWSLFTDIGLWYSGLTETLNLVLIVDLVTGDHHWIQGLTSVELESYVETAIPELCERSNVIGQKTNLRGEKNQNWGACLNAAMVWQVRVEEEVEGYTIYCI